MAKTDEGEFELILGNKQLISVFLLVVVLLGVFFSMGYIVGRNSGAPAAEAARNSAKSVPVESPAADAQQPNPSVDSQDASANPADVSPPSGTTPAQPEQPAPKPAPTLTSPASAAKSKPAAVGPPAPTKPAAKPRETAPAPASPALIAREPATGQYWQVVATSRPDAEMISELLTRKGFHAQVAPGPNPSIFRVLVGPFKDSSTQAQTRNGLEAAGFKNPIMRRY